MKVTKQPLLPCPFCGRAGDYATRRPYPGVGGSGMEPHEVTAGCGHCGVIFHGGPLQEWDSVRRWFDRAQEAYDEAAANWNKIAIPSPTGAMIGVERNG